MQHPKQLSTTGGPWMKGCVESKVAGDLGIVALEPIGAGGVRFPPLKLGEGAGFRDSMTLGRHQDNDCVLHFEATSKLHCQIALRRFRLGDNKGKAHEAIFLRDVSEGGTFVNGQRAFRPWQWLQDKDLVGFPTVSGGVVNVFEVCYNCHYFLPGSIAQPAPLPPAMPPAGGQAPSDPAPARGSRAGGRARGKAVSGKARQSVFDARLVGCIIDLTYEDPPATYRVAVVDYDPVPGWHKVDSEGLSSWDGESFTDEVDLSVMRLKFVEGPDGKGLPEDVLRAVAAAPRKRART